MVGGLCELLVSIGKIGGLSRESGAKGVCELTIELTGVGVWASAYTDHAHVQQNE